MAYSQKQKEKICRKINQQYATGKYTIQSCCKSQGIAYKTFLRWDKQFQEKSQNVTEAGENDPKKSQVTQSYEEAKESRRQKFKERLQEIAESALEYHLKLQEYEERKQSGKIDSKTGKVKVDKVEVTKKRKDPNPMLIRFTLENTDPENFKTKQVVQHEGENPFIALMKAAANNLKTKQS